MAEEKNEGYHRGAVTSSLDLSEAPSREKKREINQITIMSATSLQKQYELEDRVNKSPKIRIIPLPKPKSRLPNNFSMT